MSPRARAKHGRDGAAWTITEGAPGERVALRCLNGALDVSAVYEG